MVVAQCMRLQVLSAVGLTNTQSAVLTLSATGHDQGGLGEPATLLKQTISTCPKPLKPF